MTTLTNPPARSSKAPPPAAPQPLRPAPHWQVVLAGPIALVVARLREAGFTLRITGGFLDAVAPVSAASADLALRAIRRRSQEVVDYLLAEGAGD